MSLSSGSLPSSGLPPSMPPLSSAGAILRKRDKYVANEDGTITAPDGTTYQLQSVTEDGKKRSGSKLDLEAIQVIARTTCRILNAHSNPTGLIDNKETFTVRANDIKVEDKVYQHIFADNTADVLYMLSRIDIKAPPPPKPLASPPPPSQPLRRRHSFTAGDRARKSLPRGLPNPPGQIPRRGSTGDLHGRRRADSI